MKDKVQSSKTGKFMFDMNIFDDEGVIIRAAEPEPPPIFSLEELENAKRQAFEKGHQTAMKESTKSREEHSSGLVSKISTDMQSLFTAEHMRETAYEQEAIRLASALLKKLFPAFESRYGLDELKAIVSTALEQTRGKVEIIIETHPENIEGLEGHIKDMGVNAAQPLRYKILANESLAKDACRISWSDGGVIRDSKALADQIAAIMEETLAAKARSGHSS